jgi:hypothetical protein
MYIFVLSTLNYYPKKTMTMQIISFLYQVAIISLSGILIVGFTYYILKDHIYDFFRIKRAEAKNVDALLPLKLQAYERLILFVERINPSNILVRLHHPGISVTELQALVISEINAEFQHNITQQLYIHTETWEVARKLKDDTIAMITNAGKNLGEGAVGVNLSRAVLQHLAAMENNPYNLTINIIKKDVKS